MTVTLPFVTAYDPPGTSEGTLDPLGLYQIADQLAVQLVPAVRERMQRIRFLTAMAVGSLVTADLDDDPSLRDASPYLVWEWLVVAALIRTFRDDREIRGTPGSSVTRRAIERHGDLDARSYLKTPRIFGFHGVYKRLAVQLGIVDVHLGPGPHTERLVDAWARGIGLGGIRGVTDRLRSWSDAVARCLRQRPPRTRPSWRADDWEELARAFAPARARAREKRVLRDLLLEGEERRLGALPEIWALQDSLDDDAYREEVVHERLARKEPAYAPIVSAIRAYESFARGLQDAFDLLKVEAGRAAGDGYPVSRIARDGEFLACVEDLPRRFETAWRTLEVGTAAGEPLQDLFAERFERFAAPASADEIALALCAHHEAIQRGKSTEGKRPWFDRLGGDRIHVRHAYREGRRPIEPERYVHAYRSWPIRRFHRDLA